MAVCFVGRRGPERMTDLLTCFVIDHYHGSRSRPGSLPLDGEHLPTACKGKVRALSGLSLWSTLLDVLSVLPPSVLMKTPPGAAILSSVL